MSFLFGRRKTPQEMLRQNQRALNKAMRDLDRERQHMEQQEKKIIVDIKKMAKQGQMVTMHLLTVYWTIVLFLTRKRPTPTSCRLLRLFGKLSLTFSKQNTLPSTL